MKRSLKVQDLSAFSFVLFCFLSQVCPLRADQAKLLLKKAEKAEKGGKLWEAANLLQKFCSYHPERKDVLQKLYKLNRLLYLSPEAPPGTEFYRVKPGDNLSKIAKRYSITAGLLRRLNGLKSDLIKVGQKLKVVRGPFHVRIIKKTFTLEVLKKRKVLFTYRIGLGREDSTPEGTFVVGPKLIKPTQFDRETGAVYRYGDPRHTIGTRWITFSGSYGIHGTVEPESIGKRESKGCVRMLNKDVEELFDLVVPKKSKVIILKSREKEKSPQR